MTLVVDASVWVAVFWPDDPRHAVSRAWIERQVNAEGEILVSTLAMAEVPGPIRRRTGDRTLALQAVNALLDLPGVTVVAITSELGMLSGYLAAILALKGGDAIYAALAFMENVALVTWDRKHLERCPFRVATSTPD